MLKAERHTEPWCEWHAFPGVTTGQLRLGEWVRYLFFDLEMLRPYGAYHCFWSGAPIMGLYEMVYSITHVLL